MKLTLTGLFLLAVVFALGNAAGHASGATESAKRLVYSVCNDSRMSPTITEQQCGDLQDQTGTEFLCEEANTSPTNICWVEVK